MLLSVIENISDFIYQITTNGLSTDLIFYISLGFTIFMVLYFMIKSRYAYEGRLESSLEKINRWLFVHQQIDESNLVEFNRMIKHTPRLLRYHWQQYMLYREHEPSYYMSMYNCIEKPLHTSSYTANIKNFVGISLAVMFLSFVLSLLSYGSSPLTIESFASSLITPAIVLLFSVIALILLRSMQNFNLASLYQNFHLFNRYIDKASSTIPKYVDFEILFTRKEIQGGIPVLNEYLEKRARQEAEELEKARQNAVEHKVYNFESTGIDGSLILDRAMKESEIFLNTRQRLLSQIQQFEAEIESLKRNYENVSKDYQRKLQASKENIERLRTQQEESTNRIEVNYIKKQQQDEIKKQEQLEKDQDDATLRYEQETANLKQEIEKCRAELEEKKQYVTNAMLSEYDTFSTKVYKAILNDVQEKHKKEVGELAEQKVTALKELEKAKEINNIKDGVINDLRELIHKNEEKQQAQQKQQTQEQNEQQNIENDVKNADEQAQEQTEQGLQNEPEKTEATLEQTDNQEEQEQGMQGFYDENGYYWFENGTYYDDKGYYHDEQGDIYDENGNYISPEMYATLSENKTENSDKVEDDKEVKQKSDQQTELEPEKEPLPKQSNFAEFLSDFPVEETASEEDKTSEDLSTENNEIAKANEVLPMQIEIEQQPPKKRGRPRKTETENQTQPKPVGKRGRPRKVESNAQEKPKSTGKRGRPRKTESASQTQPKTTTGKRGRPRKTETENQTQPKPVGKRGRPRKVESNAQEKPKSTGKRGRPRKTESASKTQPKTTTGKRGRPRKKTDELKEISNQILEESNRLIEQQNELNRQLGETLQQIKEQQDVERLQQSNVSAEQSAESSEVIPQVEEKPLKDENDGQ